MSPPTPWWETIRKHSKWNTLYDKLSATFGMVALSKLSPAVRALVDCIIYSQGDSYGTYASYFNEAYLCPALI
jgi:hypothetical protein